TRFSRDWSSDVCSSDLQLIKVDAGENPPDSIKPFSGLVFMGGPMSVNDDLPWIESSLNLIRQAIDLEIPVLGHCLGGQLIAKAQIGRASCRERASNAVA